MEEVRIIRPNKISELGSVSVEHYNDDFMQLFYETLETWGDDAEILGLYVDDALVGMIFANEYEDAEFGYNESRFFEQSLIACLVVDRRHRFKGYGKYLVKELEKRIMQDTGKPDEEIILLASTRSVDADRFFESLGYRKYDDGLYFNLLSA